MFGVLVQMSTKPPYSRERGTVGKAVLILAVTGVALLVVIGLISVGQQLLNVHQEAALVAGPEEAAVGIQLKNACVPRTVE